MERTLYFIMGGLTVLILSLPYATSYYDELEAECTKLAQNSFYLGCSQFAKGEEELETCRILSDQEGLAE